MLMKHLKSWSGYLGLMTMVLLLSGCFGEQNLTALDPKGPQAQWIFTGPHGHSQGYGEAGQTYVY